MKKIRFALFALCLTLPACYDFDFPLDPKPQVAVDARFTGGWRCLAVRSDDEAPGTLQIDRTSETIARWTFSGPSSDGVPEKTEFDVHGSTLRGGAFLNAFEVGKTANGKWNLIHFTFLLPDVLRLQVVNDEALPKVKDTAELRKVVQKRANDPAIYTDLLICVRDRKLTEPRG